MRPDIDTLEMVKEAYRQLGQPEKQQSLTAKYPPAWNYLRFKGKTIKVRPRPEKNNSTADSEAGFGATVVLFHSLFRTKFSSHCCFVAYH